MDPEHRVSPVDATRPNQARVHNALLGGKDNFAPDRDAAEQIEAMFPGMRRLVARHRKFARCATAWLAAERGISQFIDVGCGLPSGVPTGDVAREILPGATVVYADADPVAVSHARALLGRPGVAVVQGDAGDPEAVLGAPELAEVIDMTAPAAVLLCGVLSAMHPVAARRAVRGYVSRLASQSAVALCCASYSDQRAGDEASRRYAEITGGTFYSHSRPTIEGFLGGLELVQGGVADVRAWWEPVSTGERDVAVLGGVGIVS